MNRIFMISNRVCKGPVGGAGGVNYKIYRANCKYGLMPEMQNVFRDKILVLKDNFKYSEDIVDEDKKRKIDFLKNILLKTGGGAIIFEKLRLLRWTRKIKEYDKMVHFSNDDIFIFHDIESAICFGKLYGCEKSALVYHHQGSLYNERSEFYDIKSPMYRKYMDKLTAKAFSMVDTPAFPSMGAKECLIESEPELENIFNKRNINIFYNGTENCPACIETEFSDHYHKYMQQIQRAPGIKFVTVSTLNESKAVERIPSFLSGFRKREFKFTWILVGKGGKEKEIEQEINKYGIRENCIWIKESVPHDFILNMFRATDFYLILHKYSIFDYAILEAMSCGNIPILSRIGGNKEVVINENGFFSDEDGLEDKIIDLIESKEFNLMKEKNVTLQQEKFSEYSSLNHYSKWCDFWKPTQIRDD